MKGWNLHVMFGFGLRYSVSLGAFLCEKWPLASSCLSVCPSVRLSACNNSTSTGWSFMKFDVWVFFENLSRKFKFRQNRTGIMGTLHETTRHFWSYLALFFWIWEIFQTEVVEKIKAHNLCSRTFFFRKLCNLWGNVWKYCRAGQAADDSMQQAHCMLDN